MKMKSAALQTPKNRFPPSFGLGGCSVSASRFRTVYYMAPPPPPDLPLAEGLEAAAPHTTGTQRVELHSQILAIIARWCARMDGERAKENQGVILRTIPSDCSSCGMR